MSAICLHFILFAVNYEFAHWEPSKLSAAALALSLKVLDRDEKSIQELWTPTLGKEKCRKLIFQFHEKKINDDL